MQEVFEKLIKKLEEKKLEHSVNGMKYEDNEIFLLEREEYGKFQGLKEAIEIVKQAAAEYAPDTNVGSNGWIPTSERLPEEMELVLIYAESTARGGSIRVVAQLDNGFWFAQTSSETLGLTGIGQYNVIAWQPLPLPYTKGE